MFKRFIKLILSETIGYLLERGYLFGGYAWVTGILSVIVAAIIGQLQRLEDATSLPFVILVSVFISLVVLYICLKTVEAIIDYSNLKKSPNEYTQALGYLVKFLLADKPEHRTEAEIYTAPTLTPPRAYMSYYKLENFACSLGEGDRLKKDLETLLRYADPEYRDYMPNYPKYFTIRKTSQLEKDGVARVTLLAKNIRKRLQRMTIT